MTVSSVLLSPLPLPPPLPQPPHRVSTLYMTVSSCVCDLSIYMHPCAHHQIWWEEEFRVARRCPASANISLTPHYIHVYVVLNKSELHGFDPCVLIFVYS